MTSTFHGLEVAKRGMSTQQAALYTTGQNIANANTPGYSRQRVNFEQTEPYPAPSMNRPEIPGQMGTGVKAGSIQRVRENFLDLQYRDEQNKVGYWTARADAVTKMEDILNEPSDSGLANTMDKFWKSLQVLSTSPENSGARSVVLSNGKAVAETFQYLSNSLSAIQKDLSSQASVTVKEINSIAKQLGDINKQIKEIEPHGYLPNDLYDERDRLIDQLTGLVDVKVEMKPSTQPGVPSNASKMAEGIANIILVDGAGVEHYLVEGTKGNALSFPTVPPNSGLVDVPPETGVTKMAIVNQDGTALTNEDGTAASTATLDFNDKFPSGKLRGIIESFGYSDGTTSKGLYPEALDKLDQMAYSFGQLFNAVHQTGYELNGTDPSGKDFFSGVGAQKDAAKNIGVNLSQGSEIAVSTEPGTAGNGSNAINLSNVKSYQLNQSTITLVGTTTTIDLTAMNLPIKNGTIQSFYEAIIGQVGVDGQQANRMLDNSDKLRQSVDERRQSVSAVSLDEEMTNMIQFQHAYNAAARNITVVDEMLDKIINGMGLVGR
ncbi:flagellar hook-associated protein FlgK [Priestia koreensis]|uniref:Flagellar hook-associated protein 1 n=1 Tax=Priestia koreensis TaxID=284581 RepID=A0A0M0KED3_9BACI|nr:flagellar hook-associated protein FlgK [Priestia koreensis]KOO37200.1 flagellar biosynthesis protein FlgK [Priestia koreensis]